MGALKHLVSGRSIVLSGHTVAGRGPHCAVHLAAQEASNDHASVLWTGTRWEARDLGSTNGTFLNGERLPNRENVHVSVGSVLRFGCKEEEWELTDERGPVVVARNLTTGDIRAADDGLLALPDSDTVIVSVALGAGEEWVVESADGERRSVKDGEHIEVSGQVWELAVPPVSRVIGTYKAPSALNLTTLALRFHVSPDEQHVRLEAVDGAVELFMEGRASFSMLLHLARKRLADAQRAELPVEEQGWIHIIDLASELRKEESHINTDVYRAREVFAKAHIERAEGIVQRRRRELRIGTGLLEVRKL